MTRHMYDAIYPANIPAGAELVASYVDGAWPNYAEAVALFPDARHVSIATSAASDAIVLDIERGDALPVDAPAWAVRQRRQGRVPCCYMSESLWSTVQVCFNHQGVPDPLWWVANANAADILPPGIIALQNTFMGVWDRSIVADYWPGVDPEPDPQPSPLEDDMAPSVAIYYVDPATVPAGTEAPGTWAHYPYSSEYVHVARPEDVAALTAGQPVTPQSISYTTHENLLAGVR